MPEDDIDAARKAPYKLFDTLKRIYEGFERAYIIEDGMHNPTQKLQDGLNQIHEILKLMREAELTTREKIGLSEQDFSRLFGDRKKMDPEAQRLLAEMDEFRDRMNKREAAIHKELATQKNVREAPDASGKKDKKGKKRGKKGMDKKYKKMGGSGWIPS